MTLIAVLSNLTNFGAAGLMAAMWLCERRLNRTRELQLAESHQRIRRDEQRLCCLTDVVNKNTAAMVRFVQHQKEQNQILKHLVEEIHHGKVR